MAGSDVAWSASDMRRSDDYHRERVRWTALGGERPQTMKEGVEIWRHVVDGRQRGIPAVLIAEDDLRCVIVCGVEAELISA